MPGARHEGRPARSIPEPSTKKAAPTCSQHWPGAAPAPVAAFVQAGRSRTAGAQARQPKAGGVSALGTYNRAFRFIPPLVMPLTAPLLPRRQAELDCQRGGFAACSERVGRRSGHRGASRHTVAGGRIVPSGAQRRRLVPFAVLGRPAQPRGGIARPPERRNLNGVRHAGHRLSFGGVLCSNGCLARVLFRRRPHTPRPLTAWQHSEGRADQSKGGALPRVA